MKGQAFIITLLTFLKTAAFGLVCFLILIPVFGDIAELFKHNDDVFIFFIVSSIMLPLFILFYCFAILLPMGVIDSKNIDKLEDMDLMERWLPVVGSMVMIIIFLIILAANGIGEVPGELWLWISVGYFTSFAGLFFFVKTTKNKLRNAKKED